MKSRILHPLLALVLLLAPSLAQARYYQPQTGRFITMDSYEGDPEEPATLHKYLYVHANPANNIDPSGHAVEPDLGRGQQVHELFYAHCIIAHSIPKYFDAEIGHVFPNVSSRLKPDVLDVNAGRKRFFELKPISARDDPGAAAAAGLQVGSYIQAMKSVPVLPGNALAEFPGRTPIGIIIDPVSMKPKEVVIEASETVPGLVYYWLRNPPRDFDLDPFLVPFSIPAQKAISGRALGYGSNSAASAIRSVAGRTAIQSRAVMAAMRTIGPSISARIGLTRF